MQTIFHEITLIDTARPLAERKASRKHCGPYRWRPATPGTGRGFYSSSRSAIAIDRAGSSFDLRLEYARDQLETYQRLRRPTAFAYDPFDGGDVLTPIIARLPRSRGFLAGWTMGEGMCGSLAPDIWETAEDAARAAYDLAEGDAERGRDDYESDYDSCFGHVGE